tara:strand:- start:391 stop:981 length:591 start_codon:yes stop_codon:yes gene_type:complete
MSEEWISLFDCETLNGWGATGSMDGWTVDDGAIFCTVQGGQYLYTEDQFDNFVLEIDYKIEPDCNSGIFLRWGDLNDPVQTGIEIQVLDTYAKEPPNCHDCGAIYDLVAPTKQTMKPAGEWNNHVITCDDSIISVELNGESIVEMDVDDWTEPGKNPDGTPNKFSTPLKDFPRKGHIGLQDHGGKVWYRNVRVKRL